MLAALAVYERPAARLPHLTRTAGKEFTCYSTSLKAGETSLGARSKFYVAELREEIVKTEKHECHFFLRPDFDCD
jgi:hypothetical protein